MYPAHTCISIAPAIPSSATPSDMAGEIKSDSQYHKIWNRWANDEPPGRSEMRGIAAERLRDCLKRKSVELDLSGLNLSSLPELPQHIKVLIVSDNNLTELPVLPRNLLGLHARNNHLKMLSALLPQLTTLDVYKNRLEKLLEPLPETLTYINCEFNRLVGLPESITRLPSSGDIFAVGNPLSEQTIQFLQDINTDRNYQGPKVYFSAGATRDAVTAKGRDRGAVDSHGLTPGNRVEEYLKNTHSYIFPKPIIAPNKWDIDGYPAEPMYNILIKLGFSHGEIVEYSEAGLIAADRPYNIQFGISMAYIASANFLNEYARYMLNPLDRPEPAAKLPEEEVRRILRLYMKGITNATLCAGPSRETVEESASLSREIAVNQFDALIRSEGSISNKIYYRGERLSEIGFNAVESYAQGKNIIRTEHFFSASERVSVAKEYAGGAHDSRRSEMFTKSVVYRISGAHGMNLHTYYNELERVHPLQAAFRVSKPSIIEKTLDGLLGWDMYIFESVEVSESELKKLPFLFDPNGHRHGAASSRQS